MPEAEPLFPPRASNTSVMIRVSTKTRDRIAALSIKFGKPSGEIIQALLTKYEKESL